jgi:hypothetical protein
MHVYNLVSFFLSLVRASTTFGKPLQEKKKKRKRKMKRTTNVFTTVEREKKKKKKFFDSLQDRFMRPMIGIVR